MILVTVGSTHFPFDRLVAASAGLVDIDDHVVVQRGASAVRPEGVELVDFMQYDDLLATAEAARLIVSHAGVGSIMLALSLGRRPVVVPRLEALGEAIDDHQLEVARALAAEGRVFPVLDVNDLIDIARKRLLATDGAVGLDRGALIDVVAEEATRAFDRSA